jgi:hypothetical protein
LTASYIARCSIASVIGVLSGAIPLADAALDAVTLHSVIGSTAAAGRVPRDRHIHVAHATTNTLRVMGALSADDRTAGEWRAEVRTSDCGRF